MAKRINQLDEKISISDTDYIVVDPKDSSQKTQKVTFQTMKNALNTVDKIPHLVQNIVSGNNWCRIWSDGWCEQGGIYTGDIRANTVEFELNISNVLYANAVSTYGSYGDDNDFGVGCAHIKKNGNNYLKVFLTFNRGVDLGGNPINKGIYWEAKGIVDKSKFPEWFS